MKFLELFKRKTPQQPQQIPACPEEAQAHSIIESTKQAIAEAETPEQVTETAHCKIIGTEGFGKWLQIGDDKILVVIGWQEEDEMPDHPDIARQNGVEQIGPRHIKGGGRVHASPDGRINVYDLSGFYGEGTVNAAEMIRTHFEELGTPKTVINGWPEEDDVVIAGNPARIAKY